MKPRVVQLPRRTAASIRADLDEEFRFYFDMRTAELLERGMSEADARAEAIREFGDLEYTTSYCLTEDLMSSRESARSNMFDDLRRDVVQSLRVMRRAPGFTATALLTIALGIGATTAIYSAVNAMLLRDLPYGDAGGIVRLWGARVDAPDRRGQISAADFSDLRARQRVFSGMGAFAWGGATFIGADESVALAGLRVEPQVFDVLAVRPLLGRTITSADVAASNPAVVVSYGLWRRLLGGDSSIVGRSINLNGRQRTVVGVLPADFFFPSASEAEFFTPLDLAPLIADPVRARRFRQLGGIARLRDGMTPRQADADVLSIMKQLEGELPSTNANMSARAIAVRDAVAGDVRPALYLLFGASVLVLLIACANVASMQVARAVARQKELALRAALGAGRGRLVRQMLTESVVLAACGGMAGLLVAVWGSRALDSAARSIIPLAGLVRVDAGVLVVAIGLTVVSGIIFGLMPALSASRDLEPSLREGGRGSTGRQRLRTGLVIGQMALSVMLLVSAGLLTRSLMQLRNVDLGYNLDSALTFEMIAAGERYRTASGQDQFFNAFYEGVAGLPGVIAVGGSGNLPLRGGSSASLAIDGKPLQEAKLPEVAMQPVSDDWFRAMGIPLKQGRPFGAIDHDSAPGVVIISEGLARQFWPGEDPLGSRVRLGPDASAPWNTVIGVVGDVRPGVSGDARPTAYVSSRQEHWGAAAVVVRTAGDPLALLPGIRRVVRALDPSLPVASVATMRDAQSELLAERRLTMQLSSVFALLALVLASVGVYGVMAFLVASRSREIGVRMALGAQPHSVFAMVLRQGLFPALVGLAIGLGGSVAIGRFIGGLLYGISPGDGLTLATVSLVLMVVTVAACLVPARRAVRVDPLEAVRAD